MSSKYYTKNTYIYIYIRNYPKRKFVCNLSDSIPPNSHSSWEKKFSASSYKGLLLGYKKEFMHRKSWKKLQLSGIMKFAGGMKKGGKTCKKVEKFN